MSLVTCARGSRGNRLPPVGGELLHIFLFIILLRVLGYQANIPRKRLVRDPCCFVPHQISESFGSLNFLGDRPGI